MSVSVEIEKRLGSFHLEVAFEAGNETLALLGASGCGKSMTLKCIAGIECPDRGRIVVDGQTVFDSAQGINLPPQQRRVGVVFQNYALFPNMTVLQNLRAGARRERDKEKRCKAVEEVLVRFGLTELTGRLPHQLSGGQQQRVALARVLVSDPQILLLDEPFSALDSHLRFRLEGEMREVIRQFGKSVLLVSHDRDEVFRMARSIAVMNDGKIDAVGTKQAVFAQPKTRAGAVLTGCKNISPLERLTNGRVRAVHWGMELTVDGDDGGAAYLGIRMHDIRPGGGENAFLCQVVEEIENPFSFTVMVRPVGQENARPIGWEADKETWQRLRGERVEVHLPKGSILLLED